MLTGKSLFHWCLLVVFSLLTVPGWSLHVYLEQENWEHKTVLLHSTAWQFSPNPSLFDQSQENAPRTVHSPDYCIFCHFFFLLSSVIFVLHFLAVLVLLIVLMGREPTKFIFAKRLGVATARAPPF